MKLNKKTEFSLGKLIIVLVILFSILGMIFFGAKNYVKTPFSSKIVISTLAPLQEGLSYFGKKISFFFSSINEIFYIYDENQRLKKENKKLHLELITANDLKYENKELAKMLNYKKEQPNFNLVAAKVVSRDSSSWSNHIIINIGKKDNIEKNMPVITPEGLVGHVHDVFNSYAEVELLTDPRSAVSAIVKRDNTRITGVVKGTADSTSAMNLTNIPQYADIKVGDVVITSGFSGIYPKGIVIGSIYKIEPTPEGLLQYGMIYPAVNFSDLEDVFVITNPPKFSFDFTSDIEKARKDNG